MEKINFTCEFEKAYNVLTELIEKGYTISQLSDIYKEEPYDIINRLLDNDNINNLNAIKDYYNSLKINEDKCLVISDTHIGRLTKDENIHTYNMVMNNNSILKNEYGLYNAYNYAIKNNIKSIIHAGDLLEGDSNTSTRRLHTDLQFFYINKKYPNVQGINTYLLYGNHDFNLMYYNNKKDIDFKINENIIIIGVNHSYVSFNGNIIKVSHYCKTSDYIKNVELPYNFELSGHSHIFTMDEENRLIKVPTLSSINNDSTGIGFLELTNEENEFVFKYLDKDTNLKNEKVLSKKLKNSYN